MSGLSLERHEVKGKNAPKHVYTARTGSTGPQTMLSSRLSPIFLSNATILLALASAVAFFKVKAQMPDYSSVCVVEYLPHSHHGFLPPPPGQESLTISP